MTKFLPLPRLFLILMLTLALTLTPLTPAMAFDESQYAEEGFTTENCKTPISDMIELGLDSPDQWFETPYKRALLLASALGDLQYMGFDDFHDDINWDRPVLILKKLDDSFFYFTLLFTFTNEEPCMYEIQYYPYATNSDDRFLKGIFIAKMSPSYIKEETGIDVFSNPTVSQFLSYFKNSYSVSGDDDDFVV